MSNPKEHCDIYQIDTGKAHTYFRHDPLRQEATPQPHGRTQPLTAEALAAFIRTAAALGITIRKV